MWGPLKHPRHVEFYEDSNRGCQNPDQDWMPMARAVQHLQSLPAALSLYAFTSIWRFHVTTSANYQECDKHASVEIDWHPTDRRFHIAFGALANGWSDVRTAEQICDESAFPFAVEPFLHRLSASSPSAHSGQGG